MVCYISRTREVILHAVNSTVLRNSSSVHFLTGMNHNTPFNYGNLLHIVFKIH